MTIDCLRSLMKITYKNKEIIVVDNHSEDGSYESLVKLFPNLKIIETEENTGFTGGNNIGLKYTSGLYILLLNNDTKVTPGFIEPLVEDLEKNKKLGIIQSKIFVMDNPTLLDSVVSYQTSTGFLYHQGYLSKDKPEYREFLYSFSIKGACMIIRREILKEGLFDDDYFAYFEETDLCWRAWLMGFEVGFEPRSVIFHKMGATSSKMNRAFINYHSFKNRVRTILKNAEISTLIWMFPIHLMLCLGLSMYFLIMNQKSASFSIVKALWWNVYHISKTLSLRNRIQKQRMVADKVYFDRVLKNPSLSFYSKHLSLVKENLSYDR